MKKELLIIAGVAVLAIFVAVLLGGGDKNDRLSWESQFATATANFVRVAQTATAMAPQVTPDPTPWPTPTPLPPDASHIAQATATAWAYSVQRHNAMMPTTTPAPGQ